MLFFRFGFCDFDLFDKVISTNLRGAFLVLAQAALHIASGGRIIAFSSSVLAKNFPTYGPYIASKAGVEGLVHVLANELRGRNVSGKRCGARAGRDRTLPERQEQTANR
jgi:NAD(P)-dependent dehydrogenase (short-subunit alcohol dehydrogenase family)